MSFDPQIFRETMRLWATGVTVVGAKSGDTLRGTTVSSFTSVTLEPPLILVCLQKHVETAEAIVESGHFAVSMLGEDGAQISNIFAGYSDLPPDADRFSAVPLIFAASGSPIIEGAMGWLDCRLHEIYDGSTHHIFIGEVLQASGQSEPVQRPLIYYNRGYHQLG
ncbi:MAG: flavin reductase family protein [Anaerolineales bacterium]